VSIKVSIDGDILELKEAGIPVTDRGFLYGDSIYEVVRTYGGRPFLLDEHLVRLARSANQLFIELPGGLEPIAADVEATLRAAGNPESYVRIIVTRGSGPIALDPMTAEGPRRVVIVTPLVPYPQKLYDEGAFVCLVATGRGDSGLLVGAKSGNYLLNVLALGEARRHGAHEAILLDHRGRVTEGATSNVFMVKDGALHTPPLSAGILEGITRRQLFGLAREAGLGVIEREMEPGDLRGGEELFLTSSIREVLPITEAMDAQGERFVVGSGLPGPVTLLLRQKYLQAAGVEREPVRAD
jgi:branched-chain amino acid aminotransferase